MNTRIAVVVALVLGGALDPFVAQSIAQVRQAQPAPLAQPGVSPAEIQQLFDAMVLMQAQKELQLTDEQYPPFLTRLRALQETRRRAEVERTRIVQELRRLSLAAAVKDEEIAQRLTRLDELDAQALADAKKALGSLDEILNPRQRALFRVFEQQMERRKVDLLTRARQGRAQQNRF
jgi:Spy/CpxP family protein refolding chaperone